MKETRRLLRGGDSFEKNCVVRTVLFSSLYYLRCRFCDGDYTAASELETVYHSGLGSRVDDRVPLFYYEQEIERRTTDCGKSNFPY